MCPSAAAGDPNQHKEESKADSHHSSAAHVALQLLDDEDVITRSRVCGAQTVWMCGGCLMFSSWLELCCEWRWVTKQLAGAAAAVGWLRELGFILICALDCKVAASLGDVSWL